MAKSDGSPWLVINYKGLNAQSARVGYPFASSKDIHLDINNNTFIFIQMDLVNAYFQLHVAKESIHMLVFMCPWGKFAMLGLPMGCTS